MKPGSEGLRRELGPVIAADVLGFAVAQDESVENIQYIAGSHSGGDLHGQGQKKAFCDPLAAAQRCDAFLTAQTCQDDPDLFLG